MGFPWQNAGVYAETAVTGEHSDIPGLRILTWVLFHIP